MNIPLFSKLTAKPRGRKVVRATAARSLRHGEEDYYDEPEPNMKLSHAFMVVLVLHIVAVGGIYAFNYIKVQNRPGLASDSGGKLAKASAPAAAVAEAPSATPLVAEPMRSPEPQLREMTGEAPLPAVVSQPKVSAPVAAVAAAPALSVPPPPAKAETKVETKAPAAPAAAAPGSYTVAKGDNPYKIAKKFGVSYKEMLALNKIDDPTKLQIGTVLKLPKKANP